MKMQAGQAGKNDQLGRKEISSAITMIALVVIYTVLNAPDQYVWALENILSFLSPTSPWINALINATMFLQVS